MLQISRVRRIILPFAALITFVIMMGLTHPQPTGAAGTVSLTTLGVAYTQDFNTLASSGTANTTVPTGWDFSESGTNANTTYRAGTGSDNTGDTYSFGAASNAERAFGGLRSGTLVPLIGAQFTNNTGATITSLDAAYMGEQWRLGQNTAGRSADRLDFQLSTDATSLTTGTWTDHNSLDFASPVVAGTVGALNGNVSPNRTSVSFSITGLSVANGTTFWIRWADTDLIPGADDGLSVDDFSLTPQGVVPPVNLTITDVSANEGDSGTTSFDFTVNLASPAGAGGVTFDIATADGSATVADNDYIANSLTGQTIPAGSSSYSFSVLVNGDTAVESDETFYVDVTNVTGATVVDSQGEGLIIDEDVDVCTLPYTPIYSIQGSGPNAAITGSVTTQGIVVGDMEGASPALRGFYLQDVSGDGDGTTSDGIFVFNGNNDSVNLGDIVRVTGTAAEFQNQTQITLSSFVLCSSGNTIAPTDVTLPWPDPAYPERYEGMLVRMPQTLYVTEHFQLGRFGQVVMSSGARLDQPTNEVAPGAPANAMQAANNLNRIIVDDLLQNQNPDPIEFGRGGNDLSASNTLRGGDTATDMVGVLVYTWAGNSASGNAYRLRPMNSLGGGIPNFVAANPRPASAPAVGGALHVVSMNLLNFFNTFDGLPDTVDNCTNGVGGASTDCRGADTQAEFDRQYPKTVAAILKIDPDVLAVNEIENDGYGASSALQFLVDELNSATAPNTYAFIDVDALTGQVNALGTDAIKVGILYKPAVVTPVATAALNSPAFVNGGDGAPRSRATFAQAFKQVSDDAVFIVVPNHLKSKGSACDIPDQGDGQGNCSIVRTNAANALASWLATDPTGTGDPDILIVGDLNSYAKEDPITALVNAGYTELVDAFIGNDAYSYVFDGQWGYLDTALGSGSLVPQVAGVGEYHINADEPSVLDYNTDFKSAGLQASLYAADEFRVSDHDPILIGLDLNGPPTVDAGGPYKVVEGQTVLVSATATDPEGDPLTYDWDLDNNGSFETPGQSATFDASALTAPSTYTIKVRATDPYGNSAVAQATVKVVWDFDGFYPPVDNRPTVNVVKAGSAVPVKFSLGGDQGLLIFEDGYPKSETIACDSTADTDGIEETATPGNSELTYSPGADTYTYVWKTKKAWAGTCRQLIIKFTDGTTHRANFKFK